MIEEVWPIFFIVNLVQNFNPYVVIYFCTFALPFKSNYKPSMLFSYTFSLLIEFDGIFSMATFGNFAIQVRFDYNYIMLTWTTICISRQICFKLFYGYFFQSTFLVKFDHNPLMAFFHWFVVIYSIFQDFWSNA
jgi:hypothetical protein